MGKVPPTTPVGSKRIPKPEVQDLHFWRRRAIGYSQMAKAAEDELKRKEQSHFWDLVVMLISGLCMGYLFFQK